MSESPTDRDRLELENEALRRRLADLEGAAPDRARGDEGCGLIIREAPIGIVKVGLDKRFLGCNREFQKFLGYEEEELLGKSISDVTYTEDQAIGLPEIQAIVRGEMKTARVTTRYVRRDGTTVWGAVSINVVSAPSGQPLYLMAFIQDVSDQRRADQALRLKNFVFDASIAANSISDTHGVLTEANAAFLKLWGYADKAEVQGRPIPEFLQNMEEANAIVAALNSSGAWEGEYCARRKDGSTFIAYGMATTVCAHDGTLIGYQSAVIDVTGHRQSERLLQEKNAEISAQNEKLVQTYLKLLAANQQVEESEERYALVLDASETGVWDWNVETNEVFFAEQWKRQIGYEDHELPNDFGVWIEHLHPDEKDACLKAVAAYLQAPVKHFILEFRFRHKDGSYRWIHNRASSLKDRDGKVVRMFGSHTDITELKLAEQARIRLEEQLRASQKMEAIGILAGGVAHDFNNLLSVILNYNGFLMESMAEDDPRKADLTEIEKASKRAVELTRQLLAFGRRQVLQPVPLNLNQVTRGIENMLRRILREDIELVQRLEDQPGLTLADPGQIEQVLMNLVVNARDAMPGGGRLTITTANVEIDEKRAASLEGVPPGAYVEIAVADTGCGMDAAILERIFEPFFTTKEKGRGTGLGLSTVFGIVKQSGGEIRVESRPGRGSTFRILLPRMPDEEAPATVSPVTAPNRVSGTETILVVEDEDGLRNVVKRVLGEAGYTVLTATNGKEALAMCEAHGGALRLVLTDVVMPEMSGKELADQLAWMVPDLRILFMSGYPQDTIVHHGVLDPEVHFLGKPFTSAALRQKVREVLDN